MGTHSKRADNREILTERQAQTIVTWTPEVFLLLMVAGGAMSVGGELCTHALRVVFAGLLTVLWAGIQGALLSVALKKLRNKASASLRRVSVLRCVLSALLFLLSLALVLKTPEQTALMSFLSALLCFVVCAVDCWSKYGD